MLAAIIGAIAGLVVAAMGEAVGFMHLVFFGLDPGERLSGRVALDPLHAFLPPCLGGLLFGLVSAYIARRRGTEVDPIEANALHGGRMSMRGSLIVAAQTVWSSGIGASVGLEAGYTQLGQRHRLGDRPVFRLRRSDMRVLVGCGAAAAIAGAFGAPLGGAFYGFELIIGSYSIASLAPVGMASLVGYLTAQNLHADSARHRDRRGLDLAVHDVRDRGLRRRARRRVRHCADARRRRLRTAVHAVAGQAGIAPDARRRAGRACWRCSRRR